MSCSDTVCDPLEIARVEYETGQKDYSAESEFSTIASFEAILMSLLVTFSSEIYSYYS
jgi:hypothetical protein